MENFKEYCKLKQIIDKDKSNIKDIMCFLDKRRKEYRVYFFSSMLMFAFLLYPIITFVLIYFNLVGLGMKFFLTGVCVIDIIFGALYFSIHYFSLFENYHDGNDLARKLNVPTKYHKLKEYCEIYHVRVRKMENLHNKITTKVYLERIKKDSDELNVYEFRILEKLFNEDIKERTKIENSVILNC